MREQEHSVEPKSIQLTDAELAEVFGSLWFNMDIDFRQFGILDDEHKANDAEKFAEVNGVRYSVLSKLLKISEGDKNYEKMKEILKRAGDIMLVARGV